MKKIRDHDKFYLKSNRYNKPKECFKLLKNILKKRLKKNSTYDLLDIGCANGELLYYLNKKFKNINFHGADVRTDLINLAKKKLPSIIKLERLDYNKKQIIKKKYDIIICSGVISIFDNLDIVMNNIKQSSTKDTFLYFFGSFNTYDFDTRVAYKDLNSKIKNFQSGWNLWSIKTIQSYFKKKIIKYPFEIKKNVKRNKNDFMRSWTVTVNNKLHFINAISFLQNQMWLEIKK
jgi:cyclopropane fatty-acyl-phospholipid synthase-like methyltransferase